MKKKMTVIGLASLLAFSGALYAYEVLPTDLTVSKLQARMKKELINSMNKMNKGLNESLKYTDADKAFAVGMMAHHKGAVDMARIELEYGTDPEMRKLAEEIIKAQGPEIEQIKQWLDK